MSQLRAEDTRGETVNMLEITNEDIGRLQENKIAFGLLPERDREIFGFIGTGNTDRYCSTGFYRCREDSIFQESAVYRIVSDYALPTPTESDIISYLQASEVPPSQWHPAAQEWAKKHKNETVWQVQLTSGGWTGTSLVNSHDGNFWPLIIRLRADYGVKKEPDGCPFNKDVVDRVKQAVTTCEWRRSLKITGFSCITKYSMSCCFKTETSKQGDFCPHCGRKIRVICDVE